MFFTNLLFDLTIMDVYGIFVPEKLITVYAGDFGGEHIVAEKIK